jgi:3',5'-cyclic AMP phosphodiesterase CpdA
LADATDAAIVPFVVKPYVQLGSRYPVPAARCGIQVMWHAADDGRAWSVASRPSGSEDWWPARLVTSRRIAVAPVAPHRVYEAQLDIPEDCRALEYLVQADGETVFQSHATAPPGDHLQSRIVVVGDVGANSGAERAVAFRIYEMKPDLIVIPGDVVYQNGRITEYRRNLYPIYNADRASPHIGAPLMRSTVLLPGLGWHDSTSDLAVHPDSLAYFMYWSVPLTGPTYDANPQAVANGYGQVMAGNGNGPILWGTRARRAATRRALGDRFQRMAHYSVRLGNVHWIVLDTNEYVDWSEHENKLLRQWLKDELAAAQDATWRFVSCYLPPFNSSDANDVTHWTQTQKMRAVVEILEAGNVDIVFSGYVHNYQRTAPLHFRSRPNAFPVPAHARHFNSSIDGEVEIDVAFDGRENSIPNGIIYIVTGAGGSALHSKDQGGRRRSWQPYTVRFIGNRHSFTVMDVADDSLRLRQIGISGRELDSINISRGGPTIG